MMESAIGAVCLRDMLGDNTNGPQGSRSVTLRKDPRNVSRPAACADRVDRAAKKMSSGCSIKIDPLSHTELMSLY
jgi:hypothetical protein